MRFTVAGTIHRWDASNGIHEGALVKLTPEPENKYDKNAIKVIWETRLIGYVPRDMTKNITHYHGKVWRYDFREDSDIDNCYKTIIVELDEEHYDEGEAEYVWENQRKLNDELRQELARELQRDNEVELKLCKKCKEEKPLSEFYKFSRSKDGLYYYCKPCKDSYDDKETRKEYNKQYYNKIKRTKDWVNDFFKHTLELTCKKRTDATHLTIKLDGVYDNHRRIAKKSKETDNDLWAKHVNKTYFIIDCKKIKNSYKYTLKV